MSGHHPWPPPSDPLGEALERWERTTLRHQDKEALVAAARNWHTARKVGWCAIHDAMMPWGNTERCYVAYMQGGRGCELREGVVAVEGG